MTQKPAATMSNAGFVHLHVHSAYSLLKGSIKIAKLGELAKADRQPALALTDTDNMFGALEFSDKMAGYGIQPIVGLELAIDDGHRRAFLQCRPCARQTDHACADDHDVGNRERAGGGIHHCRLALRATVVMQARHVSGVR